MRSTSPFIRGEPTAASSSRAIAPARACLRIIFCRRSLDCRGLFFQFLCLKVAHQGIYKWLQLAIHHVAQLVKREPNAMVCYPVLREIVSSNLFAAVTRANHLLALFGKGSVLPLQFY